MYKRLLASKIHGAKITHANLEYEGSISIPPELLEASKILPHESVEVWNVTNGNRLQTYAIKGESESTDISMNGAAAHKMNVGDIIIIASFGYFKPKEIVSHEPTVVFVDQHNRVRCKRSEVPGPLIANLK